MRYEDLNWMDVEGYLEKDDRVMVVLGACEQHAYLSLLTDVRIPQALADAAAQQTGVMVAPAVPFGASPYFLDYPGTLSIRLETLFALVEDLVGSLYRQGFRKILFLNGHGGNTPVKTRLQELVNEYPDLRLRWYAWWLADSVQQVAAAHSLEPSHANWLEAFPFTRLVEMPSEPKPFPRSDDLLDAAQFRALFGDGSFGGPYLAPDAVMDALFSAALQDVLRLLAFESGG